MSKWFGIVLLQNDAGPFFLLALNKALILD